MFQTKCFHVLHRSTHWASPTNMELKDRNKLTNLMVILQWKGTTFKQGQAMPAIKNIFNFESYIYFIHQLTI